MWTIARWYKKKRKNADYWIKDKADMHQIHTDGYGYEQNAMMESCMTIEDLWIDGKTPSTTVESIQLLYHNMQWLFYYTNTSLSFPIIWLKDTYPWSKSLYRFFFPCSSPSCARQCFSFPFPSLSFHGYAHCLYISTMFPLWDCLPHSFNYCPWLTLAFMGLGYELVQYVLVDLVQTCTHVVNSIMTSKILSILTLNVVYEAYHHIVWESCLALVRAYIVLTLGYESPSLSHVIPSTHCWDISILK